ncbi:MAG TPA: DUF6165 family protein [Rhizomicrobium sp.]|jgi:hypothetical protein|nr:DUF6165 family protein [Rhizomicrobium sp.]
MPEIPVSWGELIDKITILEIKHEKIKTPEALANVRRELALLRRIAAPVLAAEGAVPHLKSELSAINQKLWDIEDLIREREAVGDFGADFIGLTRSVYKNNDERAALKKRISLELASELVEEKSYRSPASDSGHSVLQNLSSGEAAVGLDPKHNGRGVPRP